MIGQLSRDVIGRLSVKPRCLLATKTRNVIGAFRSVYCHSSTVVYVLFKKRTGVYYQVKNSRIRLEFLNLIIHDRVFLNGFKISDIGHIDQPILVLIFRFGVILV